MDQFIRWGEWMVGHMRRQRKIPAWLRQLDIVFEQSLMPESTNAELAQGGGRQVFGSIDRFVERQLSAELASHLSANGPDSLLGIARSAMGIKTSSAEVPFEVAVVETAYPSSFSRAWVAHLDTTEVERENLRQLEAFSPGAMYGMAWVVLRSGATPVIYIPSPLARLLVGGHGRRSQILSGAVKIISHEYVHTQRSPMAYGGMGSLAAELIAGSKIYGLEGRFADAVYVATGFDYKAALWNVARDYESGLANLFATLYRTVGPAHGLTLLWMSSRLLDRFLGVSMGAVNNKCSVDLTCNVTLQAADYFSS